RRSAAGARGRGVGAFHPPRVAPDAGAPGGLGRGVRPQRRVPRARGAGAQAEPGRGRRRVVTRHVALLGKPLRRRHSQVMHDAAFDAAGIDGRYVLMELDEDRVADAVEAARGPDWLGPGATGPSKRLAAGRCDAIDADALTIGAVNNVERTDEGRLVGFNTDAPGFRAGVELALGRPLANLEVVVAGAGGAAHAVVFACLRFGAARV